MQNKLFTLISLILLLFSCVGGEKNIPTKKSLSHVQESEESFGNFLDAKSFSGIVSFERRKEISNAVLSGDFVQANEKINQELIKLEKLPQQNTQIKQAKTNLTLLKVSNILNEGNYLYTEEKSSKEAIQTINDMLLQDPDFVDPVYQNYFLGYANEIIKKYDEAIKYYDKAISYATDINKNKKIRSTLLNQKGHVYDLKGDMETAYKLYKDAYDLDNNNFYASLNLARYFFRIKDYQTSKKMFEYSLLIESKVTKSEIYFSLSSIELEINGIKPNIEKSIEYAQKSIENYPSYPMGYIALARGYYMLNDEKYISLIEENLKKALFLNPNSSMAYEYGAWMSLGKGDYSIARMYLTKSFEVIPNDAILMYDQKQTELEYQKRIYNFISMIEIISKKSLLDQVNDIKILSENLYFKDLVKKEFKRKNNGIFKHLQKEKGFIGIF